MRDRQQQIAGFGHAFANGRVETARQSGARDAIDQCVGAAGQTPQHDLHRAQYTAAHAHVVLATGALEVNQVEQRLQPPLFAERSAVRVLGVLHARLGLEHPAAQAIIQAINVWQAHVVVARAATEQQ